MAAPQNFRTAFNGFRKEDVVQYLEYMNSKHHNQISQLMAESAELRELLDKKSDPSEELLSQLEQLRQERDDLEAQLAQVRAEKAALEEKLANEEASAQPEEPTRDLASDELEAYRRAERAEREARERAELVYFQANGVLSEATGKVDTISGEITEMADHVMSQLTQLQMLVSSSKLALQDAASLLSTIRPNK